VKKQTCSKYIESKTNGVLSGVSDLSDICGKHVTTLDRWYKSKDNRVVFDMILESAVLQKKKRKE
jgi:hypothetical protein